MSISDTSVMSSSWRNMPPIHDAIKEKNWSAFEKLLTNSTARDLTLSFAHFRGDEL